MQEKLSQNFQEHLEKVHKCQSKEKIVLRKFMDLDKKHKAEGDYLSATIVMSERQIASRINESKTNVHKYLPLYCYDRLNWNAKHKTKKMLSKQLPNQTSDKKVIYFEMLNLFRLIERFIEINKPLGERIKCLAIEKLKEKNLFDFYEVNVKDKVRIRGDHNE